MLTELHWISTPFPGRLAIAPRPRGGDWLDDEMRGWREKGINLVVSLLTPEEIAEFDLLDEESKGQEHSVRFLNFPVPDRDVPASRTAFRDLVSEVTSELVAGHGVAIHCRQGIGRAALVAIGVLIATGLNPQEAVDRAGAARGQQVPETPAQRGWIDQFAAETKVPSKTI